MNKKTVGAFAAAIVTAAGMATIAAATPAAADLTTNCVGEGGAVTVPGDLVVPANKSCTLTGTTVTGDVRVARGADLIAADVTVEGRVVVAVDGYLETSNTQVAGEVLLSNAYGAYLEASGVGERLRSNTAVDAASGALVYVGGSDVTGDVRANGAELFVEGSNVGGALVSNRSLYTDVYESFIDGAVTVADSELGSVFCGTDVLGAARFNTNAGAVQLGSDGPVADCAFGAHWGANLSADGNTDGVYVDSSIVRGNVVFGANDPVAQVGANNVVRGDITGDYADWDGAAAANKASRMSVQAADRSADSVEKKFDTRRAEALASADKAGAAKIG